MSYEDDDLTSAERSAFAGLTREHLGSAELEDRVTEALRDRGLLSDQSVGWRAPRWWRGGVAVAAGAMLFAGGLLLGRYTLTPKVALSAGLVRQDTMSVARLERALRSAGGRMTFTFADGQVAQITAMPK